MKGFNKSFAAAQKSHDRMDLFVNVWIGFVAMLFVGMIGLGIYLGATTSPEGIGAFIGRMVDGFNAHKGQ